MASGPGIANILHVFLLKSGVQMVRRKLRLPNCIMYCKCPNTHSTRVSFRNLHFSSSDFTATVQREDKQQFVFTSLWNKREVKG